MLKIDMPKPTNCGDCFLCRAGKCEKAYEAYLKMGSMFFNAIYEPDFMLDDCPIEEIDKAQLPKEGEWIYKPTVGKDAIEMMFTRMKNNEGLTVNKVLKLFDYANNYRDILPKCSVCGHESFDANNYCPNCGARMKDYTDGEKK